VWRYEKRSNGESAGKSGGGGGGKDLGTRGSGSGTGAHIQSHQTRARGEHYGRWGGAEWRMAGLGREGGEGGEWPSGAFAEKY